MTEHRHINAAGLNLVKRFEGLRLAAYLDPVGIWTIGYGHTRTATRGMRITTETADALLRADLRDAEDAVSRLVKAQLNDNEFSALVSFAFNLGQGNLAKSTLLRRLNAGLRDQAAREFLRWNRAGGRVLNGLVARRAAEMALFLTPVETDCQSRSHADGS